MSSRAADELFFLRTIVRSGMLDLRRPDRVVAGLGDARRYGRLGGMVASAARRHGDRIGLVDERGTLTFAELDDRSNRLCNAWRARGLQPGDGVALLARNHRGFIDATFAACKAGARLILLNTDFAGPQVREVAEREGTALLVHDDEYTEMLEGLEPPLGRLRAEALEDELAGADPAKPPAPGVEAKLIVLTSGTTGTPKGAPREQPKSLQPLGALLSKSPFRAGEATIVATPLFHALGFAHAVVAIGLGSTLILRRRFDAEWAVDACEQYRATAIVVVPIMLRRLLDAEPDPARLSSLRIVFVGGSQLGGDLCRRAMETLGPIVYNLYGSTEVAYATIATPDELRAAPDTVGTPPRGTIVRLYDDDNRPIDAPGVTGRIFVGNGFQFEGYTGGGTKDVIDGLMSSGDVGHFDRAGRLYIDGRDDEMIVSGGENVFPAEVEELLTAHPDVVEAAAIGVDDEEFGQRLVAFVVQQDDASLTEDELKDHVRHNLARYKTPREIVFVDELPRNPTGKVLKRELLTG